MNGIVFSLVPKGCHDVLRFALTMARLQGPNPVYSPAAKSLKLLERLLGRFTAKTAEIRHLQ